MQHPDLEGRIYNVSRERRSGMWREVLLESEEMWRTSNLPTTHSFVHSFGRIKTRPNSEELAMKQNDGGWFASDE